MTCPLCKAMRDQVERLRDELEIAQETVKSLQNGGGGIWKGPEEWALTPGQARIVWALANREAINTDSLMRIASTDACTTTYRSLAAQLSYIRRKTPLVIKNIHSTGYFMDRASQKIVKNYKVA